MTPINLNAENRILENQVNEMFVHRWSPRAMSGQALTLQHLTPLFEAARWAPSAFNEQPWQFNYALRGDDHWSTLFDLVVEPNQAWAKHAGALIVISSRSTFSRNGNPSTTHAFDTGSASMGLALQARLNGLVAHGMAGFDYEGAKLQLHLTDTQEVLAMVAVGFPGEVEILPEGFREKEIPSNRNALDLIAVNGPG